MNVVDYDSRDPEDLACALDEFANRLRDSGSYERNALVVECADLIRQFDEIVRDWEEAFFGHTIPPAIARKMVEDRAKAEGRMEALGITEQDIAETMVEDVR